MLKRLFWWACFRGSLFSGGLIIVRNFALQSGFRLTKKNSLKYYENSLKQLKTASSNSPWAYIREGLLSEGYLRLRFGKLIFGTAYFFFFFFFFFFWSGGGAYYWNFTVYNLLVLHRFRVRPRDRTLSTMGRGKVY